MPDPSKDCVLLRIIQYQCAKGDYVVCVPLERLFKKCPGLGSVELVSDGDSFVDVKTLKDVGRWQPSSAPESHTRLPS